MDPIKALCANAWNWDLRRFAVETGRDPYDETTRKLFVRFQRAADELRSLDDATLAIIARS